MREGTDPPRLARHRGVVAWLRMLRYVSATNRESARRFRRLGLSTAQFDVLAQLAANPGLNQQQLAERLLVTQGNVSQLLRVLESRNLIARECRGRTNVLRLTPEGRRLAAQAVEEHETWLADRLSVLSETERRELAGLLGRLERRTRARETDGGERER
ncbi:MAG TPA: MarR family transcriptional regulator [Deinococcales bacterium]|nr:MarR family transcriptional regulator [Deinococcales bacterium]